MTRRPLDGRVAVVTGANHGIGAATAAELARLGADVLVTYLAFTPDDDDPGRPEVYRTAREQGPEAAVRAVRSAGRSAHALEADLTDPAIAPEVFTVAEQNLGPVSILVNNASAWRKDSFHPEQSDAVGRPSGIVDASTSSAQLLVDARAGALLIAELASSVRRHGLQWGRVVSLTSGGSGGFPGEASYGAAKAALENYTMTRLVTGNVIRLR